MAAWRHMIGSRWSNVSNLSARSIYLQELTKFFFQVSSHDRARTWAWGFWPAADTAAASPSSSYIPFFRIFFSQSVCRTTNSLDDTRAPKPPDALLSHELGSLFADTELHGRSQSIPFRIPALVFLCPPIRGFHTQSAKHLKEIC